MLAFLFEIKLDTALSSHCYLKGPEAVYPQRTISSAKKRDLYLNVIIYSFYLHYKSAGDSYYDYLLRFELPVT
ncbi:hypothetical protein BHG07_08305 [Brenneria salicis ATCC 15712 = DSM 30166]|nr:hypothetical protein BHG07_08305 [Brenneria salicis ATCC 15712 = DSM 30166]